MFLLYSVNTILVACFRVSEKLKHRKLSRESPQGLDFPGGSDSKASPYSAGDLGLIPVLGRSAGEGSGNPLQYSCLENPMDGGAW